MDAKKVISGPGNNKNEWDPTGQNVIAVNITYDMFYLNAGMVSLMEYDESESLGTEIDLGMDMPVTDGMVLSAVYAMFMPGDFYDNTDTAHEISAKIQYNF